MIRAVNVKRGGEKRKSNTQLQVNVQQTRYHMIGAHMRKALPKCGKQHQFPSRLTLKSARMEGKSTRNSARTNVHESQLRHKVIGCKTESYDLGGQFPLRFSRPAHTSYAHLFGALGRKVLPRSPNLPHLAVYFNGQIWLNRESGSTHSQSHDSHTHPPHHTCVHLIPFLTVIHTHDRAWLSPPIVVGETGLWWCFFFSSCSVKAPHQSHCTRIPAAHDPVRSPFEHWFLFIVYSRRTLSLSLAVGEVWSLNIIPIGERR